MSWKLLIPILCLVITTSSRPTSDSGQIQVQTRGLVKKITNGVTDALAGIPLAGAFASSVGNALDGPGPDGSGGLAKGITDQVSNLLGSMGIPLGSAIADTVGSAIDGTPYHRDHSHYSYYDDDYDYDD